MSNSHTPYSHPGQSYYHTPPPPHYYGPAPGMPYYQYPINPMHPQSPSHPPPASPRMKGVGRGGYPQPRAGAPSYQPYHHMHPSHYLHPQAMPPAPSHPANTYTHPPQKYHHPPQMPYTPPYQQQINGSYPPSWPNQTLSPVPKQLSVLSPLVHMAVPQTPVDDPPSHVRAPLAEPSALQREVRVSTPPPPTPPAETFASPQLEPSVELIEPSTEEPTSPESAPAAEPDEPTPPPLLLAPGSGFVVWSRKPKNPSRAAGVMISSRARPPIDVMQSALELPTPASSPKKATINLTSASATHAQETITKTLETVGVSSSAVTETTPASSAPSDTPAPGSPFSTNTSVSQVTQSPAGKPVESLSTPTDQATHAAPEKPPSDTITTTPVSTPTPESTVASAPTSQASQPTVAQAPAASAVPPVKKSWASLLQSVDSTASSSKSGLPTSSVIGFSVAAGTGAPSQSSTAAGVSARPELINLLKSGPTGPAPAPKIRPRGLVNTGNMCFANAVLQVLVYCVPFNRLFTELSKYISGPVVGSQKEGTKATPLVDATIKFLHEFAAKEAKNDEKLRAKGKEREEDFDELDSFIPTYVYEVMKEKKRFASMVGGYQEDAEEFLGFFLDTLEEELLSISSSYTKASENQTEGQQKDEGWTEVGKKNKQTLTRAAKAAESPITRIFGGKFRSTLRAPGQKDSAMVEDWRSLRLDIQREQVHTIKDALQSISAPHAVELTVPTRPGVVLEASQQALIEALPPVLILHLKRFLYDTKVGDVVKLGKQVAFGPDLEISSDLIVPAQRPAQPVKYQLFGVLYHHGLSASGGHYTLDVLHPNREMNDRPRQAWIRIDDELVSDLRPEDVFSSQDRDNRCAYLLFYRRVGAGIPKKAWSQTVSS